LLLLPLTPTLDWTPVAALGSTICVGFVCAAWPAFVDWLAVCAPAAVVKAARTAAAITDREFFLTISASPVRELPLQRCSFHTGGITNCYGMSPAA
jgi:hypothetical protein